MNALVIFGLLAVLMLSGMPISISLGLTVLTFLFTMTDVPLESVALKLFTGIEKFEIMAIPFFILADNFLTHGGVAKRMINFAASMVGHWYGGLGLAGVLACAAARLLLFTDPRRLPALGDADDAWRLYLRTWRPGRPHRATWPELYAQALAYAT